MTKNFGQVKFEKLRLLYLIVRDNRDTEYQFFARVKCCQISRVPNLHEIFNHMIKSKITQFPCPHDLLFEIYRKNIMSDQFD